MTAISRQALEDAIREVKAFVSADGADLELIDFDAQRQLLRLRVNLSRVPCLECVVPAPVLASLIQQRIQRQIAGVHVEVEDPRNDSN